MELQQQPPQSPRTTVQISQQSLPLSTLTTSSPQKVEEYCDLMDSINKKIERDTEKKEQNNQELKQLLLAFNNALKDGSNPLTINGSALKNIADLQKTTHQQSLDIAQLQKENVELIEKIKNLSQPKTIRELYRTPNNNAPAPEAALLNPRAWGYAILTIAAIIASVKALSMIETFIHLHLNL